MGSATDIATDAAATASRSVVDVLQPARALEGDGYPVRRAFPTPRIPQLDPFLAVDQTGPLDLGPGEPRGAAEHPNRGFESLTYVLDGDIEYADSTGGHGVTGPGGARWLTAGAGVLHSAQPTAAFRDAGGLQHHLQIWINLPGSLKGLRPRAQNRDAGQIPVVRRLDGSWFKVLAGTALGVTGPFRTGVPVTVVHASVAPGAAAVLPAPVGRSAAVYVLSGSGRAGAEELTDGDLAVLAHDGDSVRVEGGPVGADLLFLSGEPIGEPVVRSGPFVMNTAQEVDQAFDDYAHDRLGRYEA
ncbi:pirin family protein [Streptomyces sp. TBY4]|uniref:pirin family protein n=1 Tax=Streptomyces sp. TBY4 TaxID=2962030 RepID=UPI0020B6BC6B|nr:pirin-like C-terminal cupin domain-containing protein [Streptomyces sp. TBY4]MCP3755191.1 pirin family protein [Streptomyces sp. TBY4]